MSAKKFLKKGCTINIGKILIFGIFILLLSCSAASAAKIIVSSDRYSIFSPWTNKASDTSLSANFTGYALLLDDNGRPVSGQSITFRIYAGSGGTILKSTMTATTQANGLASVTYDTYNDFSSSTDIDYGTWKIEAYLTSTPATISSTNMKIEAGGSATSGGSGCETYCHETSTKNGASPLSPYTNGYGTISSRAAAAHEKSNHVNKGCYYCHPGYAEVKTGSYGNTSDVHKNRTCDYCHGTWSYISRTTTGNGNGIPKMPSCYQCHPVFNSFPSNISTLANLAAGNGKSVYSFNFDQKKPLTAHTGTMYSLVDSVPCIVCHGPAHNNSKPSASIGTSNANTENEQCYTCHTTRATTHKSNTNCVGCHSQNAHNISTAGGGGPDCISCHNTTGGSATHKVDANAIALGEHTNLNSGASAIGVSAANKKCWGCHQTGGTQPASDSMGDRYTNPYKCYDCHNATKPYTNVAGALTVSEHFKSGIDIQSAISAADNSASCITCHNIPEMEVSYTESDGLNNGNSLASHYGKNRGELRTGEGGSTDCKYCHQNASTSFSVAMSNPENNNVVNHSTSALTPVCTTCHSTGKLHDSSLSKPASSNDTYCKTCHTTKNEHKTLYCTECHANNSVGNSAGRDIHGIKYLQKDNTFSTSQTNAVDCTTCHQSSVVDGSLGTFASEKIGTLHHSNNLTNGSKWGNYWGNSLDACLYCHNDTRHSAIPLGRSLLWNPFYQMRTTIGIGTNCADCHYQGDPNYAGMSSELSGTGLNIPPEITSGSWNGKPGYYNHTLSDYTDSSCKGCHYTGSGTTVGQMLHDTSEGTSGGPDCKACHDVGGSAPKLVNFSVANTSAHKDLNSAASSTVNVENKKCWACHGDGTQPVSSHPANYKTPSSCENCHTGAGGYNAPPVKEHAQNGNDVQTAVNCSLCHDNNGMYLDGAGLGTFTHYLKDVTNTATTPYGHLGPIDTSNCLLCHNGIYTGDPVWGLPVNITTSPKRAHTETQTSQCDLCHKDSTVASLALVDFHNASVQTASSTDCLSCHTTVSSADLGSHSKLNGTSVVENGDCQTCHFGPFPMVKGAVNNSNTYFCADCHTVGGNGTNISGIKFTEKKHGKAACMDCHVADGIYHQDNPRGSVANLTYLNRFATANINTTDCADCHRAANLDDAPFNAPGMGTHSTGVCANGGCHGGGSTSIQVVHSTNPMSPDPNEPTITVPTLSSSTVTQGTDVNVTVTVNFPTNYATIDGAQYRIILDSTEIKSWTPMWAADGNFNTANEVAIGRINTNNLSGTYSIEVRGMAGGPAQDPTIRYYPINGDVSIPKNVTLTVVSPMGYINVSVTSGGAPVPEANVWITDNDIKTTDVNGNYTFIVPEGTYNVSASKQPTYNDNTVTGRSVTSYNTTNVNIDLVKKSTGTITGTVTNL